MRGRRIPERCRPCTRWAVVANLSINSPFLPREGGRGLGPLLQRSQRRKDLAVLLYVPDRKLRNVYLDHPVLVDDEEGAPATFTGLVDRVVGPSGDERRVAREGKGKIAGLFDEA